MTAIAEDLLEELIGEPSIERYLVYADLLQTRGDPRGELIALAIHAEQTGAAPTDRQRELETQLTAGLTKIGARGSVQLAWERGFVRELTITNSVLPAIRDAGWFARPELALLRSIAIGDETSRKVDAPIELLAATPFARTLERIAIGHPQSPPLTETELAQLFGALPRLRDLELRSTAVSPAAIELLHRYPQIERLALWGDINQKGLERVIDAPWQLRSLLVSGQCSPGGSLLPACLAPLLDGERHPELEHLAMMHCGFEQELVLQLARRPLGRRLRSLGLHWQRFSEERLEEVRDEIASIELRWPRPCGVPPNADYEYTFARLLRAGLDRARLALPHAERACALKPGEYYHWTELGYLYGRLDRLEDKIRATDRAAQINPKRWNTWVSRGSALRDLSRFDEAEQAYREAIAVAPQTAVVHNGLGLLFARSGRPDDAIAAFERAVEVATADERATYQCNIVEVLVEWDRIDEAAAQIARAGESAPANIRVARIDGFVRLRLGAAAEVYRDALVLASRTTAENDILGVHALRAAAQRELEQRVVGDGQYAKIVHKTDCPAWIAFAWLGQATLGIADPFAALADVIDPARVGDAIAAHVNRTRDQRIVHDTEDRTDDRITAAVCAVAAAAASGRADEARARAAAFRAYLAGPSPVKHNPWWLELADLMRVTAVRAPELAELVASTYRVATGRTPPA